ncbi:MAG: hypothetical protein ACUVV4_02450 [Candidatus Bathyarchaeia archaeon]
MRESEKQNADSSKGVESEKSCCSKDEKPPMKEEKKVEPSGYRCC